MNYLTQWKALSDRIAGVLEAGTIWLHGQSSSTDDPYATAKKQFLPRFQRLFTDLEQFIAEHGNALAPRAHTILSEFLADNQALMTTPGMTPPATVRAVLPALAGFRAEFQYQVADVEAITLRRVERAFEHLQRSIVADNEVGKKWQEAFALGETACERIGAAHLLLHGVWAFKVSGEGERTDLVFQEPLGDLLELQRAAEALVLTEWKKVAKPTELLAKARAAKAQAEAYASGVLGGLELAFTRFVVLVTEDWTNPPADERSDSVTYRFISIAVKPSTPSRRAVREAS